MEFHIPDSVVGVLMGRAKEKDSIMNYLRDTCYPAKIWIPFRERYGRSRKLIVMGWTQEVVDDAREIIYNFIKSETGNNISSLHPVFNQQDALEANWLNKFKRCESRSRSPPPVRIGHKSLYETTSSKVKVSEKEDYQNLPSHNERDGRCESGRQLSNRTSSFHPEYGNVIKVTPPELMSNGVVASDDEDDFAEILDLPPMKVKAVQKKETELSEMYEKEDKEVHMPGKMFRMKGGTVRKKIMPRQEQKHWMRGEHRRWMDQGERNDKLDQVGGLLLNCRDRMGLYQEDQYKGGLDGPADVGGNGHGDWGACL